MTNYYRLHKSNIEGGIEIFPDNCRLNSAAITEDYCDTNGTDMESTFPTTNTRICNAKCPWKISDDANSNK